MSSTSCNQSYASMANAIRVLSIDAVQKANSGHPGMPMGMAEIAVALWHKHLNHNPQNPKWINRDRFVLSNGHGSMLLYSLLHLTGYDLSIEDIKNFRQLHSKTAGHPEYGITIGVETTTGPLGQGLANAVGMALSERLLGQEFNQDNLDIINHHTYVFLGDGCLMEGVSHEACSLAGTLKLNKLIALYDDNGISIDGEVKHWFADNTPQRFKAYGWDVIDNVDGHNVEAVSQAITQAKLNSKPTLICCKTAIGQGSPNLAGTDKVHGSPLGDAEIKATKQALGWEHAEFEIPQNIYDAWQTQTNEKQVYANWNDKFSQYQAKYPKQASELIRRVDGILPNNFADKIVEFANKCQESKQNIASRKASQNAIEAYASILPEMLGGSADLTGSNLTNWSKSIAVRAEQTSFGNHINYGVREFGMSAMMNGMSLYGGYIPFGGTFLTFSDYSRNALRMAALMRIRSIFVFTHDSIGLGEDGPTHQPIEHVSSLRLIPNMHVWRPADSTETMVAWGVALQNKNSPSSLILSRQNLACQERSSQQVSDIAKGGYIVNSENDANNIDLVIIATGSELSIAQEVKEILLNDSNNSTNANSYKNIRVVSMPCVEVFETQSEEYKQNVLPAELRSKTIAIEAGTTALWYKYASQVFGIDSFGESAPAGVLFKHFGLTGQSIADKLAK
ncbi:MAG: hypothetical protein RLZZ210_699 [Pseudomonadota bacterium]|jgi:transketolase